RRRGRRRRALARARPGPCADHPTRHGGREPRGALPRPDRRGVERPRPAGGGVVTAVARVYRWEVLKLLAQKRTYLGLGAAMIVPVIFVVVLQIQSGGPNDVPLGRYIRDSGIVTPLVVLLFMSIWGFPLIT